MTLLQGSLCLCAVALWVGEGAAWAAFVALGYALWTHPRRGAMMRGQRLPEAALWLCGYAGTGMLAWFLGGYGLLRPGALGHLLPVVAWPLTAWAVRMGQKGAAARAVACFVCAALGVCLWSFWTASYFGPSAEAWVRLDTWAGEQNFVPGSRAHVMGGLYYHRLKMAHVLLIVLAPLVARQLLAPLYWPRRTVEIAMLAACTMALGLTYARAAYLGALGGAWVCAGAVVWLQPALWRRVAYAAGMACVVACIGLACLPEVRHRLLSVRSHQAAQVREVIWAQAVAITAAHPWGVGLGNYPKVVGAYYHLADPFNASPVTYPHSMVWMAWAEAGPLGLVAWLMFWLTTLTDAWRALLGAPKGSAAQVAAGAWLGVGTSFGLVGLTHDVLFHNIVALTFFTALGVTRALMHRDPNV